MAAKVKEPLSFAMSQGHPLPPFAMGLNGKRLTKESNWMVILAENCAYPASEGITIDSKLLGEIWGFEDWGMKHGLFELLESFVSLL
ncbi:hypothetical protein ACLOJK_038393 [Asimina triloba]